MKGRNSFTSEEINLIKRLSDSKVGESREEQKRIRNKIRAIGFFYSDFSDDRNGYSSKDIDILIKTKHIVIKDLKTELNPESNNKDINKAVQKVDIIDNKVSNETQFSFELFDPITSNLNLLPNEAGNYIICLRDKQVLPDIGIIPTYTKFNELNVIYTGVAGSSLRKRDYNQHFNGNAGRSTLRKSLGVLFGYQLVPRDKNNPFNNKSRFDEEQELLLSKWMKNNLIMFFYPNINYESLENILIERLNPPLNLDKTYNTVNKEFRSKLSELRSSKNIKR